MKIIKPEITAGPWISEEDYFYDSNGALGCVFTSEDMADLEPEANIKAIAALPDVLEALEGALLFLTGNQIATPEIEIAKQALEKAGYKFEES